MDLELGAIIAIALSATATLSDILHIPKKLRAWTALFLIILLNLGNEWLFHSPVQWKAALLESISAGLAAVGIYSTTKNTREQFQSGSTPAELSDSGSAAKESLPPVDTDTHVEPSKSTKQTDYDYTKNPYV